MERKNANNDFEENAEERIKSIQDLGVPKFLVNKWLNIKKGKSKFALKQ